MKIHFAILAGLLSMSTTIAQTSLLEQAMISEVVYVESPTDTDSDGKPDRIYVSINRPSSSAKLSTIFHISPYAQGGNYDAQNHNVDMDLLPQDQKSFMKALRLTTRTIEPAVQINAPQYAKISAHSVGTGKSSGCPTVGDMSETLAAKAVIDWLNGRVKAFYENGKEAKADWANGKVGMTGTSYDGTLPIMVAATGVEGLKAIVPIAAISNWYDYYRANGLVVNPGGYIGEDADVLGYFIIRKGSCKTQMDRITKTMGRENGDFTPFWAARDHLSQAKNIKAATFIIHGQSDWNVKQKNAIQLWEALEGVAPRRMFLHKGGHGSTSLHGVPRKIQNWFDHFLEGENNGITDGPQVEVELSDGSLVTQEQWPNEETNVEKFFFAPNSSLALTAGNTEQLTITDSGKSESMESLMENPTQKKTGRLIFLTAPLKKSRLLSGTSKVSLNLAVMNRKAANLTVAIIEYNKSGKGKIITRGWADPQNHLDIVKGELLVPGRHYQVTFELEPKQYRISAGSRIGVMIGSTDKDYTLRPKDGTEIKLNFDSKTFIELHLSPEN
jgi:X-Pro dipeptidyl-peptidase